MGIKREIRNYYNKYKRKRKIKKAKENPVTREVLYDSLSAVGLKCGEAVMLHSSLSGLGYVQNGPDTVINAFTDMLGKSGALLAPAYPVNDWSLDSIRNLQLLKKGTPTSLGIIPNKLILRQESERSLHPTHSWVGIGGEILEYLLKDHHLSVTPCGEKSPFDRILEVNGWVICLGCAWGRCTFWHVIEDRSVFPIEVYYPDLFYGGVQTKNGSIKKVAFKFHEPSLVPYRIDMNPNHESGIYERFKKYGVIREVGCGDGKMIAIKAKDFLKGQFLLLDEGITIYEGRP